ncbi:MAG: hypothetical protein Q7R92_01075 [bacterium]|nr:hypothetical protein [bacterium]
MEKFKKIFAAGVIFVTVLSMSAVTVPDVKAAASAGDLVKISGSSTVYYLAADGKRYIFPNEATYKSWYTDFTGVMVITQTELENFPRGANVTIRPGTKLIKTPDETTVYAVEPNGKLRSIVSEANAALLWGADWAKRVVDVIPGFMTNYTTGTALTAGAYPTGSLVKFGASADVYYTNADGTVSKFADEAALTANRFKTTDVITATIAKPTTGADIAAAVGTLTDTSSGAGGVVGAGSGLTVALASDTPASATVITNTTLSTGNGQANVNFTKVNFTAAADGDVVVKNIKFKRTGISADADVESLYLYDGATRLTAEASVSSNYVTFNNASGLFTVTKGTTKGITLKGDMLFSATSGKTIGFSLVAATDVTTNGAAVSGSFPMAGNLMSTANATDLGKLVVTNNFPTSDQTVDPDVKEAIVAKFNFVGSEQALSVEKIIFTEVGSVQKDDLANFKLLDPAGTVIGTVAAMTDSYEVIFDLSAKPYAIAKGNTKILSLRADVVKGSTRTFYFTVQNKYDILVKDTSYNVYVEPYSAGSWGVVGPAANFEFTINSGSLSINRSTAAPTGNVTLDGTNVVVGKWDFKASGEDMKVKDLSVRADTSSYGGLDNGKVYVDGVQMGSTKDLTENTDITSWGFGSSFVVKAGKTAVVQVIADMKTATSTSYTGSPTLTAYITTGASDIQRVSSLTYQSAIAATAGTASALTMSSAGLTVSKTSGFNNLTIIAGTNDVKLGSFVIAAGSSEGVAVSSITVTLTTANAATVTNMYLKDSAGKIGGDGKNVPGISNIYSLSPNITLAANGSKTIDLYANVTSGSNAGSWIANIDADGSGTVTGNPVSADAADIQTMTIAGSGTLNIVNGSMPDSAIILAGATGQYVAEYKFSAVNEGFTVDKLKLKTGKSFATSTTAVSLSYKDKDGATKTADGMFSADDAQTNATATFTGLTMYVPAGPTGASLKVYVSMTSATAITSGANSTISLDADEGFNATGDAGTADTSATNSDLASNSFYVRLSKPTFVVLSAGTAPTTRLFKFSVQADNAGSIEIKQLAFNVVTSGCTVSQLYLFGGSSQLTTTKVNPTWDGTSSANASLLRGAASGATGDNVLFISSTVETYEVKGTVSGFGDSGDSIEVSFKEDVVTAANATALTAGADGVYTVDEGNIWSDRSNSAHTTATADWTNGFLLKNMSDAQSF